VSSTDDEIRSGWMTTRDAELFGVLARGLTADGRRQVAEAVTRTNHEADQQGTPQQRTRPDHQKATSMRRLGRLSRSPHPVEKRTHP
jgi:hypothetical protein